MKNKKNITIIGAVALVLQFIAVMIGFNTAKKERKAALPVIILSALGCVFGAFVLYKKALAPKLTKLIDDAPEIDDIEDDDNLSFDDFWAKDDAEEEKSE